MDVYPEIIPDGSVLIRGIDGAFDSKAPILLTLVLMNKGDKTCEASGAIGEMDRDTIINIGLKAIELGFRVLQSHAVKGSQVTELLTHVGSDDIFDYYTVDLVSAAARVYRGLR